ncbi:hypothetical protein ACJ5H2_13590 [Nocardioides sp. R1-1]|uniref:hypothetical protein n=1 Tax=Nocardioides sp. R1-1 TaxID=3383502 RepID=UPI0038CF5C8F
METNPVDDLETPDVDESEDDLYEDMDAFWNSQNRRAHSFKLGGRSYTLPPALPLQFEFEARRLQSSKRDKDVTKLVAILFGQDSYEQMASDGVDIDQFRVLLAWAPRVLAGKKVTLAEVAAEVAKGDAAADQDPSRRRNKRKRKSSGGS